jgi:hypothetical protein
VLAQCASLAHLDLSSKNGIGDAGAESLAGVLGHCSALAHLNLSGNWIKAAGVESLAGVLGIAHRWLTSISVKIGSAMLGQRALPEC